MNEAPRILVVCTGNLCRSPLVEVLLRRELAAAGIEADVASVGVNAPHAGQPNRYLRRVAGELGVVVDEHRSRRLTADDLGRADLILTMTNDHSQQVRALDPAAAARTVTLRAAAWRARIIGGRPAPFAEWVGRLVGDTTDPGAMRSDTAHDIPDPIGGPLREYRTMGDEVRALVEALVARWSGR